MIMVYSFIHDKIKYIVFKIKIRLRALNMSKLLQLVMIVKNAEFCIAEMLREVKPVIDGYAILDTGSTDKTIEIIKHELDGVPGSVFEEPFVDFATSRNRALELAGEDYTFQLMLDDSYILKGATNLKLMLKNNSDNIEAKLFGLLVLTAGDNMQSEYYSTRIFRTATKIRYKYPVHEVVDCKETVHALDRTVAYIFDQRSPQGEKRTFDRWDKDYASLHKYLRDHQNDPRMVFYLARTCQNMRKFEESIVHFKNRTTLNVPDQPRKEDQEIYLSYMGQAVCMSFLSQIKIISMFKERQDNLAMISTTFKENKDVQGYVESEQKRIKSETYDVQAADFREIQTVLLKCYEEYPEHAEPLFYVAKWYHDNNMPKVGAMISQRALSIPLPKSNFFYYEKGIYTNELQLVGAGLCSNENPILGRKCTMQVYDTMPQFRENTQFQHNMSLYNCLVPYIDRSKSTCVFVTSAYYGNPWTISNLKKVPRENEPKVGLGGSETACANMAHEIAKTKTFDRVVVFMENLNKIIMDRKEPHQLEINPTGILKIPHIIDHDVVFMDICFYDWFMKSNFVDLLIVARQTEFLKYEHVKHTVLWIHDLDYIGNFSDIQDRWISAVFCLSEFHKRWLLEHHPGFPAEKIIVTRNGVDPVRFTEHINRKKHRFVYTSCPTRGLLTVLRNFPLILKEFPDAELHIFSNIKSPYAITHLTSTEMEFIESSCRTENRIFMHGFVHQLDLARELLRSDIFWYPTEFLETSCISAIEAQVAGLFCVYTACGALPETIGDNGVACSKTGEDIVDIIKSKYPTNEQRKEQIIATKDKYAWKKIAGEWLRMFKFL